MMNHFAHIRRTALSVFSLIVTTGAAAPASYPVQAPFDSYVCYDMSFADCIGLPQLRDIDTFRTTVYASDFIDSATINDPEAGKITSSSDTNYSCNNNKIPYVKLCSLRVMLLWFLSLLY
jgi:hypothetical protein